MAEIFKPNSKKILELFEGHVCYQIPSFQRPYSWEQEQIEELWNDILSAFNDNEEEYFLGSIILTKNNQDNNTLDVIDGQQRMTTLMILFCALRDLHYKQVADSTKKRLILGRIRNLETDSERLKLRTQNYQQTKFENEIIKEIKFEKPLSKEELQNDKFLNAAYIFKDKINELKNVDINKFEGFTDYLLNKVRVITIECSDQLSAIKLFQVLNSRGMDLTDADLIKSFLMSKLKKDGLGAFEQDWAFIENKAKDFGESLNDLFTYYEYYLIASNPKKSLYVELSNNFKNRETNEVIHQFKKLICYFDEIDAENSKLIYSLGYLRHSFFWKSILLSAKIEEWNKTDFIKLSKTLRSFFYLYWIAEYTTSKTKQLSFNIISWIKNKKDINFINERINEKIKEDKVISKVLKNLKDNVYQFTWCKPLLAILEYSRTDDSVNEYIDLDKYVHVEHILPQGYAKIQYWTNLFNKEQADKLINSLGNLTLLSGKKNIEASNRPFPKKIDIYCGKGIDGVTGYRLTQNIVDTIRNNENWTSESIIQRRDFLIHELSKLFEIDFIEEPEENELNITENIQELYTLLKHEILQIDPSIKIEEKKHYIAFKKKGNFTTIQIQNNNLKIWIRCDEENIIDPNKLAINVSNKGHHGTGNFEIIFNKKEDLNEVLNLIKQSYDYVDSEQETSEQNFDEMHIKNKMLPETFELFKQFKAHLNKITRYEEKINKYWVGYKNKNYYFAIVSPRKNFFYLDIQEIDQQESPPLIEDKVWYLTDQHIVEIKIESEEDIKKYIRYIKHSKRYNNEIPTT